MSHDTEFEIILQSIKDFFTSKMLMFALIPLLFVMVVMYVVFFTAAGYGMEALQLYLDQVQAGNDVIIDPAAPFYFIWMATVFGFLVQYSILSGLVGFLVYTLGTVFVMMFSVFLTLVVIGFLTPGILSVLHKRHYQHLELHGHGTLISPLWVLIKSTLVMILLFILFVPLYFIPVLNLVVINIPLYYFFHKLLNYDVASTLLSEEEYEVVYKKNSLAFRGRTLFLYFISMIPFITLFSAVFYIIYLGHAYYGKLNKLRGSVINNMDDIKMEKEANTNSNGGYERVEQ